jgi:hypothetical protein
MQTILIDVSISTLSFNKFVKYSNKPQEAVVYSDLKTDR